MKFTFQNENYEPMGTVIKFTIALQAAGVLINSTVTVGFYFSHTEKASFLVLYES